MQRTVLVQASRMSHLLPCSVATDQLAALTTAVVAMAAAVALAAYAGAKADACDDVC